jgi:hypothetical protein
MFNFITLFIPAFDFRTVVTMTFGLTILFLPPSVSNYLFERHSYSNDIFMFQAF